MVRFVNTIIQNIHDYKIVFNNESIEISRKDHTITFSKNIKDRNSITVTYHLSGMVDCQLIDIFSNYIDTHCFQTFIKDYIKSFNKTQKILLDYYNVLNKLESILIKSELESINCSPINYKEYYDCFKYKFNQENCEDSYKTYLQKFCSSLDLFKEINLKLLLNSKKIEVDLFEEYLNVVIFHNTIDELKSLFGLDKLIVNNNFQISVCNSDLPMFLIQLLLKMNIEFIKKEDYDFLINKYKFLKNETKKELLNKCFINRGYIYI